MKIMGKNRLRVGMQLKNDQELENFIRVYHKQYRALSKYNTRKSDNSELYYHSLTLRCECFGSYQSQKKTDRRSKSKKCKCPFNIKISATPNNLYVVRRNSVFNHNKKCQTSRLKVISSTPKKDATTGRGLVNNMVFNNDAQKKLVDYSSSLQTDGSLDDDNLRIETPNSDEGGSVLIPRVQGEDSGKYNFNSMSGSLNTPDTGEIKVGSTTIVELKRTRSGRTIRPIQKLNL
ncbi:hypothetical protein QAD02_013556 [Eretmocerus hayati]|uniref:Uncharacterized protein n=1 Tax=Eretmocerus hayati TaxID=131215 RepID=A0ACC2P2H2_9HYME|nr:hypothetical protein QAD02_013556 [Eretmocerus hayati]